MTIGICFRCGASGPVFQVEKHPYCERCCALCVNDRPDYRKNDRRQPGHASRGYGRRFRDALRPR
jgi:hypothetical protein